MKQKTCFALITVGMLLIAAGIVIPIVDGKSIANDLFRYIYAAGALLLMAGRIFSPYEGSNMRLKRLYRIEAWSAVFFCAAAFFLFYDKSVFRDALALTLAGGVIQVYTSIMIPRAINKSEKKS